MNWEAIGALAELLGATGVIASLVYLAVQIRTNNALARSQTAQALVELSSPFNLELVRNREFAEYWLDGVPEDADHVDRFRHQSLMTWWLILHENIYGQWQGGLLDDTAYRPWDRDLRSFLQRDAVRAYFVTSSSFFRDDFAAYVSSLLDDEC